MAQYEMNLRDYWLIIRRRRMIIIVCTLLVAAFSVGFARQKVPLYTSTAAVKFEQSTTLSGLLVEVLALNSADNIETQVSLIKSYPVLEEVARRLGKLPQSASGEALRESRAYQATLDNLGGKIRAARVPSTSIIEITVTSTNAREAKDLANTVAEVYREHNKGNRNARVREARKFIEAQLREVDARVKRAEEEVWAFRDANHIIAPGAESTVLLSLFTQVRGDIERTRQQRIELEAMQGRLARNGPTKPDERIYVDASNPNLAKLAATQSELMLERTNLALEVTDRHPRLQAIDDRLREVRAEMRREVAAQVAALRTREEILNRQMGDLLAKNREVPATELSLQRLQRDAKVNDDLLTLLKTRHQEALIKESEGIEEVSIVRPAADPTAPTGPETFNTMLVGGLLGLMLGLVLAFVQETLDTSIGTIEDVESYLGVRVLGIIPHIDPHETMQRLIERRPGLAQVEPDALQSHALLITHFDPKSPVAEAYRTLRTNIQFERMERGGKVLVVTSPTLQEGKTTTIVNLALTMAQNGQKTLLIGANMRRPSIYRFFGIEREPGLSDILVGNAQWRDCVRGVADILMGRFEMEDVMSAPGLDNLHIIEAGPIPANPSELLSTSAMTAFLRAVRDEYDIVLIDTPPVLPVTDSAIVAAQADGVILVYQAGKVGRLVLKRAKVHIENVGGKVWGVVLNDVKTEIAGYAYTHYYTHYYGEETVVDTHKERLNRAGAFFRRLFRRDGRGEARGGPAAGTGAAAGIGGSVGAPFAASQPVPTRQAPSKSRALLIALIAILAGALVASVVGWRAGLLRGQPRPKALLLEKLEAPPLTPAPALAPPISPAPTPMPPPAREPAPASEAAPPLPPPVASPPEKAGAPESSLDQPVPRTLESAPQPVTSAARPSALAAREAAPAVTGARFAVEMGPFVMPAEAERVERQLNQAGYQTARFRQQTDAAVYAVLVEKIPTAREAQTLVASLRDEGFDNVAVLGETEPLTIRVGTPLPLRGAVQVAERLRAAGHQVRVSAQPGEAVTFVIRHGNFTTTEEAEAKSQELLRLGLSGQVVRVR